MGYSRRESKCSWCSRTGHNKTKCPIRLEAKERTKDLNIKFNEELVQKTQDIGFGIGSLVRVSLDDKACENIQSLNYIRRRIQELNFTIYGKYLPYGFSIKDQKDLEETFVGVVDDIDYCSLHISTGEIVYRVLTSSGHIWLNGIRGLEYSRKLISSIRGDVNWNPRQYVSPFVCCGGSPSPLSLKNVPKRLVDGEIGLLNIDNKRRIWLHWHEHSSKK